MDIPFRQIRPKRENIQGSFLSFCGHRCCIQNGERTGFLRCHDFCHDGTEYDWTIHSCAIRKRRTRQVFGRN